jgi:hypothetical protein
MSAASVRTSGRRDNLPVFPIEAGNKGDCGSFSKPRFALRARKSLGLDFPGRVHGEHAFFGEPGKQHSDCRHVLLDRGRRGLALDGLDVGGNRDRFNVFEVLVTGALSPGVALYLNRRHAPRQIHDLNAIPSTN